MADSKYWTLIQRLHSGTLKRKITWEPTSQDGVFQASFPGYSVLISESAPDHDKPLQYLKIVNADGELIEAVNDEQIRPDSPEDSAFVLMTDTYNSARSQAMGIDKALDSILSNLAKGDDEFEF